jgi:hypothetical protein
MKDLAEIFEKREALWHLPVRIDVIGLNPVVDDASVRDFIASLRQKYATDPIFLAQLADQEKMLDAKKEEINIKNATFAKMIAQADHVFKKATSLDDPSVQVFMTSLEAMKKQYPLHIGLDMFKDVATPQDIALYIDRRFTQLFQAIDTNDAITLSAKDTLLEPYFMI